MIVRLILQRAACHGQQTSNTADSRLPLREGRGQRSNRHASAGAARNACATRKEGHLKMVSALWPEMFQGVPTTATPIMASRVTSPARRSSLQPAVPAGRRGSTR